MSRPKYTAQSGNPKRCVIVVRPKPGNKTQAQIIFDGKVERAAIGRSGISALKREGDGATPLASMRLMNGYLRGDRVGLPPTKLPMQRSRSSMLWCDAPRHAAYNRPVTAPFAASHEMLMRSDGLYDICLVMDWNIRSRRRNAGSAIFFHIARAGYPPTEGCVAVSLPAMKRLMRFINRDTLVRVVR